MDIFFQKSEKKAKTTLELGKLAKKRQTGKKLAISNFAQNTGKRILKKQMAKKLASVIKKNWRKKKEKRKKLATKI